MRAELGQLEWHKEGQTRCCCPMYCGPSEGADSIWGAQSRNLLTSQAFVSGSVSISVTTHTHTLHCWSLLMAVVLREGQRRARNWVGASSTLEALFRWQQSHYIWFLSQVQTFLAGVWEGRTVNPKRDTEPATLEPNSASILSPGNP